MVWEDKGKHQWLLQPRVDEERAVGKQLEFYKSQLMKPCPQKLPCFAVNHFLNRCTLTLEEVVQILRFPTKNLQYSFI